MSTAPTDEKIEPFPIAVPDADLESLVNRLHTTRWPDQETVPDHAQGPQLASIQALCGYWATEYDWLTCESALNQFGSYRTGIDGLGIHFLHITSPEPTAVPLLLCHGWPGSVLEFRHLIGPLTDPVAHGGRAEDAFHVVIPSMPGFGFSDKPATDGWNTARIARAWALLMTRLGYDQWYAQGGDWGASVIDQIGRLGESGCRALHFNLPLVFASREEMSEATPDELRMLARGQRYVTEEDAYMKQQSTRPQTIGYSLADSPAGLAAWIYTLFQDVTDSGGLPEKVISRDEILDDIMMYWLTNTGASSARLYWEAQRAGAFGSAEPQPTPAGFSIFPGEAVQASRRWIERRHQTVLHYEQLDRGGHFAALEQPELLTEQIRTTFRKIRSGLPTSTPDAV